MSVFEQIFLSAAGFLFGGLLASFQPEADEFKPWIGQEPPGDKAELFASGIVSDGMNNRDMAISPDGREIYYSSSVGNHTYTTIFMVRWKDGQWIEPQVASFATNPKYKYLEPAFSPDGNRLYFASDQPLEGTEAKEDTDIWVVEKIENEWSEPVNLGPGVNSGIGEYFPSVTSNGTLYFTRTNRKEGTDYIYRSEYVNGRYQGPELLPEQVNCGKSRFNGFISADEDYMILPVYGMEDSFGGTDYYIIYRNPDDTWNDPINLGPSVNSSNMQEWSPFVSPDGKYFFFMSARTPEKPEKIFSYRDFLNLHNSPQNGNSDIYWIRADFIEELKVR